MVLKHDTNLRCLVVSIVDAIVVAAKLLYDLWYRVGGHAVHLVRGYETVVHIGQGPAAAYAGKYLNDQDIFRLRLLPHHVEPE